MNICINIGHFLRAPVWDPGARSHCRKHSEWSYNTKLAKKMVELLNEYDDIEVNTLSAPWYNLVERINLLDPDFTISLHCNAYNNIVTGGETLYYESSSKSKALAQLFQDAQISTLQNTDRGIKGKNQNHRGGSLLQFTHAPIVLVEPFFISSPHDLENALEKQDELAQAYVDVIVSKEFNQIING